MTRHRATTTLTTLTLALLAGCGAHSPAPPAGHQTLGAPGPSAGQCAPGNNHSLGACQPQVKLAHHLLGSVQTSLHGLMVDLSNNDPVYGVGAYRAMKAHGVTALYVKLTEGTGFVDSTAYRMAHDAKAAGLRVGGYDFAHVCNDSASSERALFEQRRAITGANTLPGVLDAEYGGGCGSGWVRAWRAGGETTSIYTGAWWWNPSVGCYWPADAQAWVSGYGVSYPSMPCGRSHLDSWQYTDAGFNGATRADLSVGVLGTTGPAPKPPNPHLAVLRRELAVDRAENTRLHTALAQLRKRDHGGRSHGQYLGAAHKALRVEARIRGVEAEISRLR